MYSRSHYIYVEVSGNCRYLHNTRSMTGRIDSLEQLVNHSPYNLRTGIRTNTTATSSTCTNVHQGNLQANGIIYQIYCFFQLYPCNFLIDEKHVHDRHTNINCIDLTHNLQAYVYLSFGHHTSRSISCSNLDISRSHRYLPERSSIVRTNLRILTYSD